MKHKTISILFLISFIPMMSCGQQKTQQEKITPEALSQWKTLDKGKSTIQDDALIIEEVEGSDGYFLISPKIYRGDYTVSYQVKALSESSVFITLFSASQTGNTGTLELPPSESTSEQFWNWRSNMQHYNLTFNNRSHGYKPFFLKNISPHSRGFYETIPDNIVEVGEWYDVEIGKKGEQLWFKLNDTVIFDITDCHPLDEGHLIFRISGTTGDKTILAKVAIKDVVITFI